SIVCSSLTALAFVLGTVNTTLWQEHAAAYREFQGKSHRRDVRWCSKMVGARRTALICHRCNQPSLLGTMHDVGFVDSLDDAFVDDDFLHVTQAGQIVHRVEQHIFEDRSQAPRSGLALH